MGIKETHVLSGVQKFARQVHQSGKETDRFFGALRLIFFADTRLSFELKKLFITMSAVLCQHLNLFDFNFDEYNFKLILYIFLILSIKTCGMLIKTIDFVLPVESFGLRSILVAYKSVGRLVLVYLFCFMYEFPTPLRLLFLGY